MCAGAGADPNAVDVYGRSPLHYSAHTNCPAAFALVAEAGGQVDHPDVEGPPVLTNQTPQPAVFCTALSLQTNLKIRHLLMGMSALRRHHHLLLRIPLTAIF
jgi:hypothetical protein